MVFHAKSLFTLISTGFSSFGRKSFMVALCDIYRPARYVCVLRTKPEPDA